jgi:hypothetical protein
LLDSENLEKFRILKKVLNNVSYNGIPLFNAIKIPLEPAFRNNNFNKNRIILTIRGLLSFIRNIFTVYNCLDKTLFEKKFLIIVDHNRVNHIELARVVSTGFLPEEVGFITKNKFVFKKLQTEITQVGYVRRKFFFPSISFRHLEHQFQSFRLIYPIKVEIHIKILILNFILSAYKHIDLYERLLNNTQKAVVTVCDALMNEHIITSVAKKKGIKTYTLQHGMVGETFVPVVSDYIFVWGDISKNELIELGVPEKKVIVSGKPLLKRKVENCLSRKQEIRRNFTRKYNLNPLSPVVIYFATNWGDKENRGLIKTFSSIMNLEISTIIKLRPGHGEKEKSQYKEWLSEIVPGINPLFITEEDVFEIFTAVDLLVTSYSGAPVEALAFGTASVILDIYDYMELPKILPHYHDCLIVKDEKSLKQLISRLLDEGGYSETLEEKAKVSAIKYFGNIANTSSATELISQTIQSNVMKKQSESSQ